MTDLDWTSRFDGLSKLDPKTRDYLTANSKVVKVPAKTTIFGPGKSPQNMLFLLDGTVRVQQSSDSGHEIVLYRIHAGESCVLTTACLLAYEDYSAEGISETDVSAAAIPRKVFDELVATSDGFRNFVFAAFSKRITNLFLMIDEVAFQRLDVRLAHKLVELAAGADTIAATHQNLAAELGTAREVISRQLQEFQRRGWIEQSRGKIAILQRKGLENLAQRNT
ncbi:MAG: Crp/Fnr family transcriptional regulator [Yoonia sp.]|nr:Crp/Fnr family transcriptional regulator [Yoonia sp.]